MDLWYVKNISFATDIGIIVDTVKSVVKKEGISSGTSVTMEEFMGTPQGVKPAWKAPESKT